MNLFPDDENAFRLKAQTYLLSEFLEQFAPDFQTATLQRHAVVHGHCHHKALMGMHAEESVLRKHVATVETLDAGCCGMAGAFGFEAAHYDVSIACGERVLLPAVRDAPKDTLIIADGFSCREQIAQTTNRRALHLAEVLRLALRDHEIAVHSAYPEREIKPLPASKGQLRLLLLALAGGAALATAATFWRRRRKR